MKLRLPPLGVLLALAAVTAAAQSPEPPAASTPAPATTPTPKGRLPEAKRSADKGPRSKSILPDPDLLDGSSYEKEKRAEYGMISEIEMGEESGGKNDKISPDSGPSGPAGAKPPEDQKQAAKSGGGAPPPPAAEQAATPPENAGGGSQSPTPQGPASAAAGAQADNLKVPEGASGGGPPDGNKPQAQKIGDASLQIQTLPQNTANVVGLQGSSAQQSEKKTPSGGSQSSGGGNAGAEKGRVVPKGL